MKGYRVCWWFGNRNMTKPTCRTLSASQHGNAREAAETVLMANPSATVKVVSPRGGRRGAYFKQSRSGRAVRTKTL